MKTKLVISLLFLLLFQNIISAAEFKVKSFNQDLSDLTAIQQKVTDDNGDRTGILKI